jgi:hypothetical protein
METAIRELPEIKKALADVAKGVDEMMIFLKGRLGTKGFETEMRERLWVAEKYIEDQKVKEASLIEEEKERKKQRHNDRVMLVGTLLINLILITISHFWK